MQSKSIVYLKFSYSPTSLLSVSSVYTIFEVEMSSKEDKLPKKSLNQLSSREFFCLLTLGQVISVCWIMMRAEAMRAPCLT